MAFGESSYEKARKWLEDEGPVTEHDFKTKYFNDGLFRVKGREWEQDGLIIPTLGKKGAKKEFFADIQEGRLQRKRSVGFIQTKRGPRKVAFVNITIKSKRYRKGQYVPLNKKERKK